MLACLDNLDLETTMLLAKSNLPIIIIAFLS